MGLRNFSTRLEIGNRRLVDGRLGNRSLSERRRNVRERERERERERDIR